MFILKAIRQGYMLNKMRIEFLALSRNEEFARIVAASFVSQLNPTVNEIDDVKIAVSEAVTNANIHAYEDNAGSVEMQMTLFEDSVLIEITDYGRGIEDIEQAMETLYTSKPELERSGMGFTVMQNFMDKVEVSSDKTGTKVLMAKTFLSVKLQNNKLS
jgi:stage II sporulation protein AB (anti-sigma F factor)